MISQKNMIKNLQSRLNSDSHVFTLFSFFCVVFSSISILCIISYHQPGNNVAIFIVFLVIRSPRNEIDMPRGNTFELIISIPTNIRQLLLASIPKRNLLMDRIFPFKLLHHTSRKFETHTRPNHKTHVVRQTIKAIQDVTFRNNTSTILCILMSNEFRALLSLLLSQLQLMRKLLH